MEKIYDTVEVRHIDNPAFVQDARCPEDVSEVLSPELAAEAQREIAEWEGYAPTPLHCLNAIARSAGVRSIYYKDEGVRFSPGSFKALGGAYAVQQLLRQEIGRLSGQAVSLEDIRERRFPDLAGTITVATATDGNHGRSVAWGAGRFGCRCVIYVHREVSAGRCKAMERYGAEVRRIDGNYDDSVHRAQADATENGWFIVSDTSYPGYTTLPRYVMAGYTVMMKEALEQIPGPELPTHVFLQGGCGGLAAAAAGYLWQVLGDRRPRLIVVEPVQADCLYQSVSSGRRVDVNIREESVMAGLSCGEVSTLAWMMIRPSVRDFVSMNDDLIAPTMRLLAQAGNGRPIIAGESAVPGLAALLAAARQERLWKALGLDGESRVLVLGTEGATDPGIYRDLTGVDPGPAAVPATEL
ncbi:MAG: diaminopropionate ammonia-lyase [Gammaproteobacteria bacterium]|nr:diaminopropionate ammonia-lyase [Gammaproteobacteria bacterium]